MAKLDRVTAKVFAASAAADEIGQFGSAVAGAKLETADVATIQGLSAWLDGWSEALVSGNRYPALQEMNGLLKVLSYQGAYALQEGIPEYDSATTYYIGSIVKKTGTFELYGSLTDDNVGNALTVDTEWQLLIDLANVSGGGVVDFENYGEVTTNLTLLENKISTAYFSTTSSITLPTITNTTKQVTCILDFTTASSGQPTITNTNLKWSNKNNGKAPSAYSIISGIHNVLTFKSVWENSTLYWEAEYDIYGGTNTLFTRPNLSANGTMGGGSFAVRASAYYDDRYAYKAVDGSLSTPWANLGVPTTFDFYNPNALKVTSLNITNYNLANYAMLSGTVYGSNDDSTYTAITPFSNSVTTAGASWNINLSSNTEYYKYYRISCSTASSNEPNIAELGITATYISI